MIGKGYVPPFYLIPPSGYSSTTEVLDYAEPSLRVGQ